MSAAAPLRPGKVTTDMSVLDRALFDGMTVGIGGFGLDRKPMALVKAIAASSVLDLTIETYSGGFDTEALIAAGKVSRISSCHIGLDHFGLAPQFRAARENGRIVYEEWSELSQLHAWRAAADGAAFVAVPMDPRSDLLKVNPSLKLAPSPFDGSPCVYARAPRIDLAILHAEAAHPEGWAVAAGDQYLDVLLARAATTVILTTERLMDDAELERRQRETHLLASYVDAVIVAPGGALPGSCLPDYMIDFPSCRAYCEASGQTPEEMIRTALAMVPDLAAPGTEAKP